MRTLIITIVSLTLGFTTFAFAEESGLMTGSLIDYDQTVVGWHSCSAYDTNILDDSLLGE